MSTIDRSQIAFLIGPLIPDTHSVLLEVGRVRLTLEKPQQLVNDRAQVELLRGQQGKTPGEVEAQLGPEDPQSARARAGLTRLPVGEEVLEEIEELTNPKVKTGIR